MVVVFACSLIKTLEVADIQNTTMVLNVSTRRKMSSENCQKELMKMGTMKFEHVVHGFQFKTLDHNFENYFFRGRTLQPHWMTLDLGVT